MNRNADEIQRAAKALGFPSTRFCRLPPDEEEYLYQSVQRHFVLVDKNPRLWWEHFPSSTGVQFADGDGWRVLDSIVPNPDEKVWFIAKDSASPEYSVWEGRVRTVQAVISDCYCFEYYLIQKEFHWLVCESHHNVVIAVGEEVEDRLGKFLGN